MASPDSIEPVRPKAQTRPSLAALFVGFLIIGAMSFGGGLAGWIRREVVQKRAWLDDQQFISGFALCNIVPGATNVNLAVFIGTQLRGGPGALATLAGMMLLPLLIVLVAGMLYLATRGMPGGGWLSAALAGAGAAAIGLNLATGIRLARRNIRRVAPALIAAAITVGIGILRVPLFAALLVMIPLSLLISWAEYRR